MENGLINLLLVEDNPDDVDLLRVILAKVSSLRFRFKHVERLSDALESLNGECFDVILLDLSLPDSQGLESLTRLQRRATQQPVIVLTGLDDETIAIQALQKGAQDYLVKGNIDSHLLVREPWPAERHRACYLCIIGTVEKRDSEQIHGSYAPDV